MPDLSRFDRRTLLVGVGGTAALLSLPALTASPAAAAELLLDNPVVRQRADPHIVAHSDGTYYLTATVPEYDRLVVRGASTIAGLGAAAETVVWTRTAGELGGYIWAPELHRIDGRWYLYFAAGRTGDPFRVRIYVLESDSADPRALTWSAPLRIHTAWDTFSLDATTFTHAGTRYLVWAQTEPTGATNSNLYISAMASPTALTGPQTRISVPTLDWETRGYKVNEGASVIIRNGRVFLTYSASATDANYCVGLLTASATADLLDAAAWTKSPNPVFASSAATGQYGPGHNQFTVAPDGSDLLVYHARDYRDISGDPLFDPNRHTRVQKLYWNTDGTPNLGVPVPSGAHPVRLRSTNFPDRYVRHYEFRARLDQNVTPLTDSQFRIVAGQAGPDTVSFESSNFPGRYLRVRPDATVFVDAPDGSATFTAEAGFRSRDALSPPGVSFESVARPGQYLRHRDYLLTVGAPGDTTNRDATFVLD